MNPKSDKPSRMVSLRDKVYDSLHMDIITGKIAGGTRLVESAVASELEVSRTPVREALQKLASEGFLHHIPRAGYIVENMSDDDIQDLFSTREEIEKVAVRWASAKILPRELDQLRANLEKTDEVLRSGATQRMIDLDTEFHHVLYRATRSKTLFQISQSLSDRTLKFRIACIHFPEVARRAREGHARIVEALEGGDEHSAESAVESHLVETRDDIIRSLKQIREENFMTGGEELTPPPLRTGEERGGR
jgi:DNA-binding GntR family transcriptional regulator